MFQPPLTFSELEYDPKKKFRLSTSQNKDQEPSNKQEDRDDEIGEFSQAASPSRNTAPEVQPGPQEPVQAKKEDVDFSTEQDEFAGPKSAEANTTPTPESQPKEASEQPEQPQIQLPDLRQGIPSTLSEEFLKRPKAEEPQPAEEKAHHEIDITEGHTRAAGGASRGRGGSGGDDLPKSAYETSIDRRRNQFASYMYMAFGIFGIIGAVYLGRNWESEEEERAYPDAPSGWDLKLFWNRMKARTSTSLGYYTEPTFPKLLPNLDPPPPYTLVISLEDLMIHSEWDRQHGWRTAKRPGLDYFLRYLSQYYEIVLFTTMPAASADQIIRKLDPYHLIMWPLFREATRYEKGEYVKVRTTE
jgi:import inner membrane translocase subunit TIM50